MSTKKYDTDVTFEKIKRRDRREKPVDEVKLQRRKKRKPRELADEILPRYD